MDRLCSIWDIAWVYSPEMDDTFISKTELTLKSRSWIWYMTGPLVEPSFTNELMLLNSLSHYHQWTERRKAHLDILDPHFPVIHDRVTRFYSYTVHRNHFDKTILLSSKITAWDILLLFLYRIPVERPYLRSHRQKVHTSNDPVNWWYTTPRVTISHHYTLNKHMNHWHKPPDDELDKKFNQKTSILLKSDCNISSLVDCSFFVHSWFISAYW